MNNQIMRITSPDITDQGHSIEIAFLIGNRKHEIYFISKGDFHLSGNLESFLATAILPCMKAGCDQLIAEGDISQQFLLALSEIQDIYCVWDDSFHRTTIKNVQAVRRISATESRVGMFFSGGVDSFYTFLKHQNEITDLIFVHGLDINLDDTILREKASKKIKEVASEFGKNLIEIETNIREFLDPYIPWGMAHGAGLAAIGHLLSPMLHRIYIASTHTYADLFPWGSHPVLDPLWSSESLEFIHDGCEATRVQKVSFISKYEIALQSLRVCWSNPDSSYNCGRCEKCLRTMINLKVNNAHCTTFDEELDIRRVSRIMVDSENARSFIKENLDALEKCQGNDELKKALRKVLNRPQWVYKMEKWLKKIAVWILPQKMQCWLRSILAR